jgi:hypothetical protein
MPIADYSDLAPRKSAPLSKHQRYLDQVRRALGLLTTKELTVELIDQSILRSTAIIDSGEALNKALESDNTSLKLAPVTQLIKLHRKQLELLCNGRIVLLSMQQGYLPF